MGELPLDPVRVVTLVADAVEDVLSGHDPAGAARKLLARRRPDLRELAAARAENLELHGGGTPDVLKEVGITAAPVPPSVLRLRRSVDEVLLAAEALLSH